MFRNFWLASIAANFGTMILTVGAAWTMTVIDGRADRVAGVYSAVLAPVLLLAMIGGTLADVLDRRRVAIGALLFGLGGSLMLVILTFTQLLSASTLLACCFLVGSGNALFSPAWQTSVAEQFDGRHLPRAILLNSASYNLARSAGPALGGFIVATAGTLAAFALNSLSFMPMLIAFWLWRRAPAAAPGREPITRELLVGLRFAIDHRPLREALGRALLIGLFASVLPALAPVLARDQLHAGPQTYGLLLGALGLGAIVSVLSLNHVRARHSLGRALAVLTLAGAAADALIALVPWLPATAIGFFVAGASYNGAVALLNVSLQTGTPRWIAARALGAFQSVVAGGVALGSLFWGIVARHAGIAYTVGMIAIALGAIGIFTWFSSRREPETANL